jgi:hypothetical protein
LLNRIIVIFGIRYKIFHAKKIEKMKSTFILLSSALLISASAVGQSVVTTGGQKNTIITDGTGAWCPYCSDGLARLEDLSAANPKLIEVAMHNSTPSQGRYDNMENTNSKAWNSNWCVAPLGYPYGTVDCHFFGLGSGGAENNVGLNRGNWAAAVSQAAAFPAKYDLTMKQSYDPATKKITVQLTGKALVALTGKYHLNVWLLEDEVTGTGSGWNQANSENSTPGHKYYQAGTSMPNFKHPHVMRAFFGSQWGDLAQTDPAAGDTITKTFTYTIPATFTPTAGNPGTSVPDLSKMHLVGIVQKMGAGSTTNNKDMDILNSVEAVFLPWATDVQELNNFTGLALFPNPASDLLTIRTNLNTPAATTVTITNTIGQVVFAHQYPQAGSLFAENISLSNVPAGLYLVKIESNGSSVTEKVIVSK